MLLSHVWHAIHYLHADAWSALAAWFTALVAVVASSFALSQVREAKKLRTEQAQPYVVAYMDFSADSPESVDLVIRNFGTTVARDVRLSSSPPLTRALSPTRKPEEVWIFDCLPVLVPGQEWRTWWDTGFARSNNTIPNRYEVTVSYSDSHGKKMEPTVAVLDWNAYAGQLYSQPYGMRQATKALVELSETIGDFKEHGGGGISVTMRDGDAKDQRRREDREDMEKRLRQQAASARSARDPGEAAVQRQSTATEPTTCDRGQSPNNA